MPAGGQWRAAVEHTDIVESEKPTFEQASTKPVLAVDPPAEIRAQPAKHSLQKIEIGCATHRMFCPVQKDRRPGLYRRGHVTEDSLVGGGVARPGRIKHLENQGG